MLVNTNIQHIVFTASMFFPHPDLKIHNSEQQQLKTVKMAATSILVLQVYLMIFQDFYVQNIIFAEHLKENMTWAGAGGLVLNRLFYCRVLVERHVTL